MKAKMNLAPAPEGGAVSAIPVEPTFTDAVGDTRPRVTFEVRLGGSVVVGESAADKVVGKVHDPFPKTTPVSTEEMTHAD